MFDIPSFDSNDSRPKSLVPYRQEAIIALLPAKSIRVALFVSIYTTTLPDLRQAPLVFQIINYY